MKSTYAIKPIGDVISLEYGKPLPEEGRTPRPGIPAYGANGILCWSKSAYRDTPSIIVGRKGSAGEVNITDGPFWPTDVTFFVEHDDKSTDLRYLFHLLRFLRLPKLAKGVKPGINRNDVYAIRAPFPPLDEQKRIVAILDEAFEGVAKVTANAERNLAKARALFEATLRASIQDVISGSKSLTLAEIASQFGRGKSRHRPRNDPKLYGGSYPFIQTGDVRNAGHYIRDYSQTYNEAGLEQSKLWPKGTICITIAANIAETSILTFDACFPDSVIGVIVDKSRADEDYVEFVLQYFKVRLKAEGKGSAQDNINLGTFEEARFPFPELDVQRGIVASLNAIDAKCTALLSIYSQKLVALASLKQSLLSKAFSGQLRSKVLVLPPLTRTALSTATPEFTADILAFAFSKHLAVRRDRTFGRVKGQKVLHMVESVAGVDLGREPIKDAAGPNDSAHMRRAEQWAAQHEYFSFVARNSGGYEFKRGKVFDRLLAGVHARLSPYRDAISRVVDLLLPMDSEEAEVLATVHAAWNNLLVDGINPTREAIIAEARENWTANKLGIPEAKFADAIKFIRKNDLVPDGSAKPVRARQESLF